MKVVLDWCATSSLQRVFEVPYPGGAVYLNVNSPMSMEIKSGAG
jgi:hypothetical protein